MQTFRCTPQQESFTLSHFFEYIKNECRFSSPPCPPLTPQLAQHSLQTTMNRKPEAERLFESWPPQPEERSKASEAG
jgi:hypothetical protein